MKLGLIAIGLMIVGCSTTHAPPPNNNALQALDYSSDADCSGQMNTCVANYNSAWASDCAIDTRYCDLYHWAISCAQQKHECLVQCGDACLKHIGRKQPVELDGCVKSCIGNE